jgi:GDP-L-fucose synthase
MSTSFWRDKKVLVTGGAGFIGSHVVEMLVEQGALVTVAEIPASRNLANLRGILKKIDMIEGDLRELGICVEACRGNQVILNLVARVGGIKFSREHPAVMFRDNILVSTNMIEAARLSNVERFLVVSSACVYRRDCSIPTPESEGFIGVPEPTNDGYGWAKRMAEFQADTYRREFGLKAAIVRPYNTYGPRDHFSVNEGHVIAALIKRIFDGENPLKVWGDGEQTRSFLYVTDLARGIILAAEKYAVCDPVNLGSDEEIRIKDLVELVVRLSGKKIDVEFVPSELKGQPRRRCDVSRAREKIGFVALVGLEEGVKKTIDWYLAHKDTL